MANERVTRVDVIRGAPCGATWQAALRIIGNRVEEAGTVIGLAAQMHCSADPAGWDIHRGKSPVHLAGDIHRAAFARAMKK